MRSRSAALSGSKIDMRHGPRWRLIAQRVWRLASPVVHRWPAILVTGLIVSTCIKAATAVDMTWDSLSYQIPFSALRAGLMTPWQFQRGPIAEDNLAAYYAGFPILADVMRGWMWRLSGWPEATNLFAVMLLGALVGYLKWAFRVPAAWAFIALLAIPLIQTAVASSYVDVPANAALAIFIFSICDLWVNPEKWYRPPRWIVMFLAAFVAANMKLQTTAFVCLAMPFVLPPAWRLLRARNARWPHIAAAGLVLILAALLVQYNLVKNLLLHSNPFWPVDMRIAGIQLAGAVSQDAWLSPGRAFYWLSQYQQWLISVLEFHSLDGRDPPYSNGMGMTTNPLAGGMGGFFSGLVVASICFFILCVWRRRDRLSLCLLGALVCCTLICAVSPNAQILRYDTFWMMLLVISCLLMLQAPGFESLLQSYKIILIAALAFITSVTAGASFIPAWGPTLQEYVDRSGAEKLLERVVQPGDVICLEQGPGKFDNRFTIMFAPIFHQRLAAARPYGIKEGWCDGYKTISGWR